MTTSMTTAEAITGTIITVTGTPTAFLPLATAWPSKSNCNSNIFLFTPVTNSNTFIAWDPLYGKNLATSAQSCLPEQVSAWWLQPSSSILTALGPAFQCPGAYSAVQTAVVASSLHQTFCCPSSYSLLVPHPNVAGEFPSQCISSVTSGQTFAHLVSPGLTRQSTTTVIMTASAIVFAIPVNGFAFAVSSTKNLKVLVTHTSTMTWTDTFPVASALSTPTGTAMQTTITETSKPNINSGSTATDKGNSIHAGVYAGVLVAVFAAVGILVTGVFFLFRRRKRLQQTSKHQPPSSSGTSRIKDTAASSARTRRDRYDATLDEARSCTEVYELPAQ